MKKIRSFALILCCLMAAAFLSACDQPVEALGFETTNIVMQAGTTQELSVNITPTTLTNVVIEYSSSNTLVASIVEGNTLLAKTVGTARIYAKAGKITTFFDLVIVETQTQIETPTGLRFDDLSGKIVWNNVENAVKYEVKLNNTVYETASLFFDEHVLVNASNSVQVRAVGLNNTFISSPYTSVVSFVKLGAPQGLLFNKDTQVLSWTAVEGVSYRVSINGTLDQVQTTGTYQTRFTSAGTYEVAVVALNNNSFSTLSEKLSIQKLAQTTGARIDSNKLLWNAVSGAQKYILTISSADEEDSVLEVTNNQLDFANVDLPNGQHTVSIVAVSDSANKIRGNGSVLFTFDSLPKVSGLTQFKNQLSWSEVTSEVGTGDVWYAVSVSRGGIVMPNMGTASTSSTSFTIPSGLSAGNYVVKVFAYKNGTVSTEFSELTYTITLLATPVVDSFDFAAKTLTVTSLAAAEELTVRVNGVVQAGSATKTLTGFSFVFDSVDVFNTVRIHEITAQVMDDASANLVPSNISASYTVEKLAAPEIEMTTDNLVFNRIARAVAFDLYLSADDGSTWTKVQSNSNVSYQFASQNGGTYLAKVVAVGNNSTILSSAESAVFDSAVKFSAPTVQFDKASKKLLFGNLTEGKSIQMSVEMPDGSVQETVLGEVSEFAFEWIAGGTYTVSTRTLGSENYEVRSNFSASKQVVVLNGVGVVNHVSAEGTSYVSFDAASQATSYEIMINTNVVTAFFENDDNGRLTYSIGQTDALFATHGNYTIKVRALSADNSTLAGVSSQLVVTRLAAPASINGPTLANVFSWNPVTGAIAYDVQFDLEELFRVTSPLASIAIIELGEHSISVFSVGNGETTLSSLTGRELVFEKRDVLATVTDLAYTNVANANLITFTADSRTIEFEVSVNGVICAGTSSTLNSVITFEFTALADALFPTAGSYSISVITKSGNQYISDSEANTAIVVRHGILADFDFTNSSVSNNGLIEWENVLGNNGYDIYVNGSFAVSAAKDSISQNLSNLVFGENTIAIFIKGNETTTLSALEGAEKAVIHTYKLATPEASFDKASMLLTVVPVESATSYTVRINSGEPLACVYSNGNFVYQFSTEFDTAGNYNLFVIAHNPGNINVSSSNERTLTVTRLAMVSGIIKNADIISWTAVNGVGVTYSVVFGINAPQTVTNPQISVAGFVKGDYLIYIQALSSNANTLNSVDYCEALAFEVREKIAATTNLDFKKKTDIQADFTLSFDGVQNALEYNIMFNGELFQTHEAVGTGRQTAILDLTAMLALAAGRYTVVIITVPVDGLFLDNSLQSASVVIEKLTAPTALSIQSSEQISFALLSASVSSGYEVISITDGNGQGVSYSNLSEYDGVVTIKVRNLGLNDLFIESNEATFVVTRLATPQAPTINNDLISWNNSSNSVGTKLVVKQNNVVVYQNVFGSTVTSYNFPFTANIIYEITAQHTVSTSQQAYLQSRVSLPVVASKLLAPTAITLEANGENQEEGFVVSWTHDGVGVVNYSIYINGVLNATTIGGEKEIELLPLQSGTVYQIGVKANGDNANGFVSSATSTLETATRLGAPTQLAVNSNAYLTWSAVSGAVGYKIEIYSNKTTSVIPESVQTVGSSQLFYNFASLLLEGDYAGVMQISVMAIGNGTTLLSSENALLSVTKIADTAIQVTDFGIVTSAVENFVVKLFVNRNNTLVELPMTNGVFTLPDNGDWNAGSYEFTAIAYPTTTNTTNLIRSRKAEQTVVRLETPSLTSAGMGFVRAINNTDVTQLKWSAVSNSVKYQLKLGETVLQSNASTFIVIGNTIPAGNLNFEVIAFGTAGQHFASRKTNISAFKLTENFSIRNASGLFTWDFNQADSATALRIAVTQETVTYYVETTNLQTKTNSLEGFYGQLSIQMRAVGNVGSAGTQLVILDSNYTSSAQFLKLATPQQLKSTNGVLGISNNEYANEYYLTVTNATNPNDTGTFGLYTYYLTTEFEQFVIADTEYNAYTLATRQGYLSSDTSNIISFKLFPFDSVSADFRVERLSDESSCLAWEFPLDEQLNEIPVGGFKVRVTYQDGTSDSIYNIDAESNSVLLSSPYIDLLPGVVHFQLSVTGTSEVDGNGTYWLSSKFFGDQISNRLTVTKLAAPVPNIDFGTIVWGTVEHALEHRLLIIESLNTTTAYSGNALNSFDLAATGIFASEVENKSYSMNMIAIGNGVTTISSTYSHLQNKAVVLPKAPGSISIVEGGLRFTVAASSSNYYDDYTRMSYPNSENYASFNPYYGYIQVKLSSGGVDRYAYLWPELLKKISGSPFASKYDSTLRVATWYDGVTKLTHSYTNNFPSSSLSYISYLGIDDLFPNLPKGTYSMSYRQMGDSTNLLSSKFSSNQISITVLDSVKNVKIIESLVDGKPYLTWSAVTNVTNAGSYVPTYQILAFNSLKNWWDCLYETTNTSILIDNTNMLGGVDGVTFLYPYHKNITVLVKGNTSGSGLTNYVTSVRAAANTLNVSVLAETEQFGVQNGLLQWNRATNSIKYSVKYTGPSINDEYFAMEPVWDMNTVQPGLYSLIVQAIGNTYSTNNSAIINGKPSVLKRFYKLAAPSVSVSWGYFTFNQVEVAQSANNLQFIATRYLAHGSLNASANFALLEENLQVKTLPPSNTSFGSTDKWNIEYISPKDDAYYFRFQAFGSESETESGKGFITSDFTTIPNNLPKYRLPGFASTETIEVIEGKLVWTRKATAPLSNYYWLQFTKTNGETEVVVNELVQLPPVYAGDAGKVEFELSNAIDPGSWRVVVKNTNSNFDLNSMPSVYTDFVKLRNIAGENISGGFVNWNSVVWDLEDTTGCSIIIEFEDPSNVTNKYQVRVNPSAIVLNETTVQSEYASVLNNLPAGQWKVRIKTGKTSLQTDVIKVVDSVWTQIGLTAVTKLNMVSDIEKSGSNIIWTAPDQSATYHYKLKIQQMNDTTKAVSNIERTVEQAQYTPDGGYSVMSIQIQTIPTSGDALASSWTEAAIFTELSAPPVAEWNALLKGFELRIPLSETVPTLYHYSISVKFKASGTSSYITQTPILQDSTKSVYYPMRSGYYQIAYAIVVGGVVGKYQHNPSTGETVYCTERLYNDFASGEGTVANPFLVTRSTNLANIQFRSWAQFRQTEGSEALPVTVTAPIVSQQAWVTRTGNIMNFSVVSAPFTGKYDGNNLVVQMTIAQNASSDSVIGMFEKVGTGAVVTNFKLKVPTTLSLSFKGQIYLGWVAGQVVNNLMITGQEPIISKITILAGTLSINYSNITGGLSATIYYGSIAGNMDGAIISEVTSNLNATYGTGDARSYFGGIVGLASSQTAYGTNNINFVTKAINNGNISASVSGGLICNASLTKISQSANKGNVTSSVSGTNFESSAYAAVAGGIIALATRCELEYVYNRGTITINNAANLSTQYTLTAFVGGLIARAEASISIKFSYNAGSLVSDLVNTTISKRAGFVVGFVASATPVIERLFFAALTMPNGVTPNVLGTSRLQSEMQASTFVGTLSTTVPSTHFTAVSGNYPKLSFES